MGKPLEDIERIFITETLAFTGGNREQAARDWASANGRCTERSRSGGCEHGNRVSRLSFARCGARLTYTKMMGLQGGGGVTCCFAGCLTRTRPHTLRLHVD